MIQKIVGISFNPTKADGLNVGTAVNLVHDASNQFSSRAIAVHYGNIKLGHIGEKGNEAHEEVFNALPITAKVCTVSRLNPGEEFGKFGEGEITHLEVEFKMASDEQDGIRSFNEADVLLKFDPVSHRYTHKVTELISATSYIKKWIKEFDAEAVAGRYAESLGSKKSEILGMWDGGGNVAAQFGTAIHNALEHYEKYKEIGKTIQMKKDLPFNKALPSHPELRRIVEQFISKFGDQKVKTEVLVTNIEKGICGTIDRLLILGEKKCRIQDYKVNIGSELEDKDKFLGQMAGLPPNKLSKYRLQLSVYARIMQLSGWEVEGIDAYVYENEWKHYPMETIKLDF